MTETTISDHAGVELKTKSSSWIVWLLPIVASLVGAWLVYDSIVNQGVSLVVRFDRGANIKLHETNLLYEGIVIGNVIELSVSNDLQGVNATIEISQAASSLLQHDTLFWLVEPEVSISRVSGLDTLLSGKYIAIELGKTTSQLNKEEILALKPNRFKYKALDEVPLTPSYLGGLHLTLSSNDTREIAKGAPLLYKNVKVGKVEKLMFGDDADVELIIYVEKQFRYLVKHSSRFWNVSGISVQGNLNNIDIQVNSITSLMIGGIAFSSPKNGKNNDKIENGQKFKLHESRKKAFENPLNISIDFSNGEGLQEGTLIKYNGIKIGEVTTVEIDPDFNGVTVIASLIESARSAAKSGTQFWVVKPKLGLAATQNIETLVVGRYITLKPSQGGKEQLSFVGVDAPPVIAEQIADEDGLRIVLEADDLASVKSGVKVSYKKIAVGSVLGVELADNAQKVLIYLLVKPKYSSLVRENSRFWNSSGVAVDFSLFSGAKIKTDSLESLLEGGIAFATPNEEEMGEPVVNGFRFQFHEKALEEWLKWSPSIQLNKE